MKVAIFDFDGTLIPDETFPLLMKYLKTHPDYYKKYRSFLARMLPVHIAAKCKLYPVTKRNEFAMKTYFSSLGTTSDMELNNFFSEIGSSMRQNLSKSLLTRLEQHRKDGYHLLLVSGAYEQLLTNVMKDIEFDEIIGTRVHIEDNKMDYVNGKRKVEVILEALAKEDVDWQHSFAYGDSYSDLNVLELVGNPVAVKPDSLLLQEALNRKWEVIEEDRI